MTYLYLLSISGDSSRNTFQTYLQTISTEIKFLLRLFLPEISFWTLYATSLIEKKNMWALKRAEYGEEWELFLIALKA